VFACRSPVIRTPASFVLAVAVLGCAAIGTAAVLVPAPPAALPAIVAACIGLPFLAARDVLQPPAPRHGWRPARLPARPVAPTRRELRLPPPDPHESPLVLDGHGRLPVATVVFAAGPPSPESDRAADRLLDLRPGLLIVVAPG
jgi:hypothetical protein